MARLVPSNEKDWQRTLIEAFTKAGWAIQHVYKMPTGDGRFVTSTTAKGWPDLVCLRDEWIVGCEVKGLRTPIQDGQIEWLERFAQLASGRAWMLRPNTAPWEDVWQWIRFPLGAPRRVGYDAADIAQTIVNRR